MTTFLAGFAIGTSTAMWIRWEQTHHLRDELARHHRITRSALARALRLERRAQRNGNLNYAGSFDGLENLRPELVRPFTVEHADPVHWDELSTQLPAIHHDGGES